MSVIAPVLFEHGCFFYHQEIADNKYVQALKKDYLFIRPDDDDDNDDVVIYIDLVQEEEKIA